METSCMLLKLKEEIDALSKTKAHIQNELNKKIKDIDNKIAMKMELQAQISARNIRYLRVFKKTKGSGYYSPKKHDNSSTTPTKALSVVTGNTSISVSPGVSAFPASGSSPTSLQAQDIDEDFVGDADLIAASIIGEAIPSTSAHDSTFACVGNPDTKTDIAEKQQAIAPTESVSISELENVTCTSDGGDNGDEHVTHEQPLGILEQEPVEEQQIPIDAEGGINVVNDEMQHANVDVHNPISRNCAIIHVVHL